MEINEEHCKSFGNGRKVMKLWIITLQFQLKKENKQTCEKSCLIRRRKRKRKVKSKLIYNNKEISLDLNK